jgi:hypothetical protein
MEKVFLVIMGRSFPNRRKWLLSILNNSFKTSILDLRVRDLKVGTNLAVKETD